MRRGESGGIVLGIRYGWVGFCIRLIESLMCDCDLFVNLFLNNDFIEEFRWFWDLELLGILSFE